MSNSPTTSRGRSLGTGPHSTSTDKHDVFSDSDSEEGTLSAFSVLLAARRRRDGGERANVLRLRANPTAEHHDVQFDMDEDLDVDVDGLSNNDTHSHPGTPSQYSSSAFDFDTPSSPPLHPTNPSSSYRPSSSFRPSNSLSHSYATLLAQQQQQARPPLPSAPSSSYSSPRRSSVVGSYTSPPPLSPSSSYNSVFRSSSSRERGDQPRYVQGVDRDAARDNQQQLRDLHALDAPSHRAQLTSKSRSRQRDDDDGSEEDVDEDDLGDEDHRGRSPEEKYKVGSVPIPMSFGRPGSGPSNNGNGNGERKPSLSSSLALERKSSGSRKGSDPATTTAGAASPMTIASPTSPTLAPSSGEGGRSLSSSLAQSLRSNANVPSFGQVLEQEEAEERDRLDEVDEDKEGEEEEEVVGTFLPPHELAKRGRGDEDLLSRSVGSY